MTLGPRHLPANQLDRFYRGGERIRALRRSAAPGNVDGDRPGRDTNASGVEVEPMRSPEEWLASTTTVFGHDRTGLSRLAPSGELLQDAIRRDPVAWLGQDHVDNFGPDPALLVKLLDAGERLPVHVHPDRSFARTHLGDRHGKTEAWIVLAADGDEPAVWLGFRQAVARDTLAHWVDTQDVEALLDALHAVPVQRGDTVVVPAGTPHAIGAGLLVLELQEPTDWSILLEWEGFDVDGRRDGHLGLGFDVALDAVRTDPLGADEVRRLRVPVSMQPDAGPPGLLAESATGFFRAARVGGGDVRELPAGFMVLVATSGAGRLACESGEPVDIGAGDVLVVPHAAGAVHVVGDVEGYVCRPPGPDEPRASGSGNGATSTP